MNDFMLCPTCSAQISTQAVACPKCGHAFKAQRSVATGVFGGLFAFFVLLPIGCIACVIVLAIAVNWYEDAPNASHAAARATAKADAERQQEEDRKRLLAQRAEARALYDSPGEQQRREDSDKRVAEAQILAQQQKQDRIKAEEDERTRPMREQLAKLIAYQHQQASNGYPSFQLELGKRYLRGDGVETNLTLARYWLQSACTNGESQASNLLARLPQ